MSDHPWHEQAIEIRAELPKTAVGKLSKKERVDEEARKAAQNTTETPR